MIGRPVALAVEIEPPEQRRVDLPQPRARLAYVAAVAAARAAVNGTAIGDEGRRQRAATTAARSSQLYSAPIGALSPTLDATFFALSDAKRRGILERLGRGPATLSQLASPSGLTLNGIKKHVGVLELAGLVETEKVGRARECRLSPAATLGEAGEWIEAHRRAWEGRLDRFARFVEDAG
jgi:DNA-binding transcriptional ArsR family regulator